MGVMPGSGMAAVGGMGALFLFRRVKRHTTGAGGYGNASQSPASNLERVQSLCEAKTAELLRRKMCPIEVTYSSASSGIGPPKLKICLYPAAQAAFICAVPAGGFNSDGGGVAQICRGEKALLKPRGSNDTFMLRAFKPALLDVA